MHTNTAQRRHLLWLLLLASPVLILMVANATTLAKLHFYELVNKSTAVARLRCLGSETFWEKDEIWTKTRFEVIERVKGNLPGIVVVRMIGGRLEHLNARVDGAPDFRPGEEVYLFLWGPAKESLGIVGWGQGTFRIRRDPQGGVETVTQDSADIPVLDPQTGEFSRSGIQNMPVPDFLEKLRKELRRSLQ
jgi:hypothetical protein